MCPVDGKISANWSHIEAHKDVSAQRLKVYAQGIYSSNVRGPFHEDSLVDSLYDAARESKDAFKARLKNFLLCAGVGLTPKKCDAMEVYNMAEVFKEDYVIPKDHLQRVIKQADQELESSDLDSTDEDNL
ncbi:uncharacterized protein LOC127751754 [Frankliniella occidentalis]|uniref:Uncharacterized protein LOC127751754 n=1 Tax=Frankliniella occidentalis TaxID=133901 RepID=A0A9C6X9W4_FRAOC|nr:uncharacterized protein LOC127751754 [Frankliniella occidentalis]